MALSLSGQAILCPHISSKPSSAPNLAFTTISSRFTNSSRRGSSASYRAPNHILGLYSPSAYPRRSRRPIRPMISAVDTTGEGSSQNTASSWKPLVNLKILFKAYREAVLVRDIETLSEIESLIYELEKEKDDLDQKVLTLSAEISTGREKLIRLQADFENFRKRSEKERLTIRSDAQSEVIESLLPMVDNFERAKQQLKPDTEMEKKIDVSYQGIYKQFVEIMRSLRVSVVATVGKPFDPKLHEAISREESHEYKEGIIIQEFRRGFILGDKLIRPAMVKVSSGPGRKKPIEPSD